MTLLTVIAPACDALGLDPLAAGLQLLPAGALVPVAERGLSAGGSWSEEQGIGAYDPPAVPYPLVPTRPALVCGLNDALLPAALRTLLLRYPTDHPCRMVTGSQVVEITLGGVAQWPGFGTDVSLFLPALASLDDRRGPDSVGYVIARLLGPGGCPWDRAQTHRSIRRDLLAETHEALEAIDADDTALLAEELGDVLLNVALHLEIARQAGEFAPETVYAGVVDKLVRRHPHVFGDVVADDSATVLRNWHAIKDAERSASGKPPRAALDGIPPTLPALQLSQELTRKAARAGFAWGTAEAVWEKIDEERAELRAAAPGREREEEYGDLLMAVATLGWRLDVDAESALRSASAKFRRRFAALEALLMSEGQALNALTDAEKLAAWQRIK